MKFANHEAPAMVTAPAGKTWSKGDAAQRDHGASCKVLSNGAMAAAAAVIFMEGPTQSAVQTVHRHSFHSSLG